jgi:putative peptide zinc metalloprotease protein
VLPRLREELSLHPGPPSADGAPSWTLKDPVRNAFFRLSWPAFEILARWNEATPAAILRQVHSETALRIEEQDIGELADFLSANQLLRSNHPGDTARLIRMAAAKRLSWASWLLHHYLFIRVPLIRPDRFLDATRGAVDWIFTRAFVIATLLALVLGLVLIVQQWDSFRTTLVNTFTLQGAVYYALALSFVKTMHEFGHAYTAKRFGCRVPTMGVAFLVLWPVLYTDVNETWTLPRRRDRLAVGASGMVAELTIAAWSTLLWAFLPECPLRQMAFVLAAVTWVSSLAINCSPFMRFDGYFLLMDALNMPNLHARAFITARWWLRETLFALREPPPEPLQPSAKRLLVGFALLVWVYRLALFLGIAALVYHFFIKIVGIGLFCVEIGWFIVLPIAQEFRQWTHRRDRILGGRRVWFTSTVTAMLLLAIALPWQNRVGAPAVLKADGNLKVFVPAAARLVAQRVQEGQHVIAGQILFIFDSPEIVTRRATIEAQIKTLQYQAQSISYDGDFRAQASVIREQLATAVTERAAMDAEMARLTVTAGAPGTVVDLLPDLHANDWISPDDQLATIRGDGGAVIDAYVRESDLARISLGDTAEFYSDAADQRAVPCTITFIDRSATPVLTDPELASSYGGGIPVRARKSGLAPEGAVYRLRLEARGLAIQPVRLRGQVEIAGLRESMLSRTAKSVIAVLMREGGI